MNITIIAVGKLKENYLRKGIEEYKKRLAPFASCQIIELKDEKVQENFSEKEKEKVKEKEGERILSKVPPDAYAFVLDPGGKMISSEKMAAKLDDLALYGKSKCVFIIGGSLGLSKEVLNRADFLWSFSSLTFPHQLMRLILMEQIYRFFQIQRGTAYHK